MIPKKIHYVWVGDQPKSELILKCIESWKKHLPDYELIEWGNEKIKKIKNKYSEQAYRNKKWAFVSDYIRLYALYNEGGIYLDTDVEITQSLDSFLNLDFFTGYEIYNDNCLPITSALMGASKNNHITFDLLNYYETARFETENGLNLEPNTVRISDYFSKRFSLQPPYDGAVTTYLEEKSVIYPSYYFCKKERDFKNYALHFFNGSWLPSHSRKDKFTFFNKFILSRFMKVREKGTYQITSKEKLLFCFSVKKNKMYALIMRK